MSAIADASLRRLTEEQREIAEVAFAIGAKYADRRFDDHSASLSQWDDLSAAGLTGLSLPEEHGGAAGCSSSASRPSARRRGYPAAKLVIATAIAGSVIARHGTGAPAASAGSPASPPAPPGSASPSPSRRPARTRTTGCARHGDPPGGVLRLRPEDLHLGAGVGDAMIVVAARPRETRAHARGAAAPCEGRQPPPGDDVELPSSRTSGTSSSTTSTVPPTTCSASPARAGACSSTGSTPSGWSWRARRSGWGAGLARAGHGYARSASCSTCRSGRTRRVQHPLAEAFVALEGAWMLVSAAARLCDAGEPAGLESNMAKIAACDAGLAAADSALQCSAGAATPTTR